MKIKNLKGVLFSRGHDVQMGILFDRTNLHVVSDGSIDYIVKHYGDVEIEDIAAIDNKILLTIAYDYDAQTLENK